LQGKIGNLSVYNVFLLISSLRKSGTLNISSEDSAVNFFFSEGRIIDAQPIQPIRKHSSLLGMMLRDAGYITDDELERVLEIMGMGGGRKIGDVLIEQGMAPRDIVAKYLILQIKECLFDVLACKEGHYKFEKLTAQPASAGGELARPETLIMEIMQFLDEYPGLRQKFPLDDFRVLRKKEEHVDPNLFPDTERILWKALAFSEEPERVFRKACMTIFEGTKSLAALYDRGLVEIETVAKPNEDAARQAHEKKRLRLMKWQAGIKAALWIGALVVALIWIIKLFLSPGTLQFFMSWTGFF